MHNCILRAKEIFGEEGQATPLRYTLPGKSRASCPKERSNNSTKNILNTKYLACKTFLVSQRKDDLRRYFIGGNEHYKSFRTNSGRWAKLDICNIESETLPARNYRVSIIV